MGQAETVETVLEAAGLTALGRVRDLAGIERCVLATRPEGAGGHAKKVVGKRSVPH